jgi:uncharacterized membrane protein YfcA
VFLLAVAVAVIAGTTAQSVVGFGFALLVVPILSVVAGPQTAVVVMTSIGVPMTFANAVRWRRDLERRSFLVVSAAAFAGMPLGTLVLTRADERTLTLVVGVTVLAFTVALWRGLQLPPGRTTELTAGALSGALATSVGTNGPPLVVAFHATGMAPEPFRATLAAAFAVQGSIALATFWAAGLVDTDVGRAWLVGVPAAVIGALTGDRVFARIDRDRFRTAVLVMLAGSGLLALVSALRG